MLKNKGLSIIIKHENEIKGFRLRTQFKIHQNVQTKAMVFKMNIIQITDIKNKIIEILS